jgi:hypothetical protein
MDCIFLHAIDQFTMSCPETSKVRRYELLTFRNGREEGRQLRRQVRISEVRPRIC